MGCLWIAVVTVVMIPVLILLLPSRTARIKITNHAGAAMGFVICRWLGPWSLTIKGRERLSPQRPAIYIGNHTSIIDALTSMWLTPTGTVGVGKREVAYLPFLGQLWMLAGHLLLDRKNPVRARRTLNRAGELVRLHGLHMMIWAEGTRSRDGRLKPFKKGFAHMAIATGLPVVPMITTGADKAWPPGELCLYGHPVHIEFLAPIETKGWTLDRLDEHIEEAWEVVRAALPDEYQPVPASAGAA